MSASRNPRLRLCLLILLLAGSADSAVRAQEAASEEKSFTVVLLPDTQFYSEKHPDTYMRQTLWIRQQLKEDNIKCVIHLGDIVQNPTNKREWENANRAMQVLDGVVPFSVAPGNHDMNVKTRDTSLFNTYFSPQRFADRSWYGGHMDDKNDNNFCYFNGCGMKFMVVNLEYSPRDEALQWASSIVKRHPEHRIILATHYYMNRNGRSAPGEKIWNGLVRKHPNIFLTVSGHISASAFQISENDAGGKVAELLTDYQNIGKGGDGWLRTLRFVPGENKVHVKTYSPLLKAYKNGKTESFSFEHSMSADKGKAG